MSLFNFLCLPATKALKNAEMDFSSTIWLSPMPHDVDGTDLQHIALAKISTKHHFPVQNTQCH